MPGEAAAPSSVVTLVAPAIPLSCGIAGGAELAPEGPLLQVRGIEYLQIALVGEHGDHHPFLLWLMPEHVRVAKIFGLQVGDGIPRILRPGTAAILTYGNVLSLPGVIRCCRIDRDQARRIVRVRATT